MRNCCGGDRKGRRSGGGATGGEGSVPTRGGNITRVDGWIGLVGVASERRGVRERNQGGSNSALSL